jgi:hypothetical protein
MKKHFKTVVHQVEVLGDAGWLGNIIIEDMGLRVETLLKILSPLQWMLQTTTPALDTNIPTP